MRPAEVEAYLAELTERLTAALLGEPFRPSAARVVGQALANASLAEPDTLDRTLGVLAELPSRLAAAPGDATPASAELRDRIAHVQGAVAAGFVGGLRERARHEQETVRRAAQLARGHAEEALRRSEARFKAVFAEAAVGIGVCDLRGRVLDANEALRRILGYSSTELRRRDLGELFHPADAPAALRGCDRLARGEREQHRGERRLRRKDGAVVWANLTVSLVRDADGAPGHLVALVEDVTDRRQLTTRLRRQAERDPLTGLPNRALFLTRLTRAALAPGDRDRLGLCYIDLDGFKLVNDSLGHDVGDQLLVAIARRLDDCVSGPDHLVARLGGDEFVILVERSAGARDVIEVADRALAAIARPVRIGGHELSVSASIGILERPAAGLRPSEAMRAADITLYWAKNEGRGRWAVYDEERNAREVARNRLSASMPAALERGEFVVEYQPLVHLASGRPVGVEALTRWRHPTFGLIGPDRFIPLAEETGWITRLGRWVLAEACRQARRWTAPEPGGPPFVSVNLAVRQCREPGLVEDVAEILRDTGLPPARLQLELTESALMGSDDEALDPLRELAAMGITIAIDDFGTGYSNLAYLRRLPVRSLKIAGSFMAGMRAPDRADPVDERIVGALVSLAHTLGLTVTAEGVETTAQADRLRALGCDVGQGWLFARSLPADGIAQLIRGAGVPHPRAIS